MYFCKYDGVIGQGTTLKDSYENCCDVLGETPFIEDCIFYEAHEIKVVHEIKQVVATTTTIKKATSAKKG